MDQAQRQIRAAKGDKIKWFFENKEVMEATKKLFDKESIKRIELIYKKCRYYEICKNRVNKYYMWSKKRVY